VSGKLGISQDRGSLAPLGVGLFAISLSFVLSLSAAQSMFIFQKRLTNFSEMAAIFAVTHNRSASEFQSRVGSAGFIELEVKDRRLEDGKTQLVEACALWVSPVMSSVVSAPIQICSRASSRAG
jgi:hypothetical protein